MKPSLKTRSAPPPTTMFAVAALAVLLGVASPLIGSNGDSDPVKRSPESGGGDVDNIKRVIEEAYVMGLHERQDEAAVRAGFHDEFRMYVREEGGVVPVTVDEWLGRVDQLKAGDPELWQLATRVEFVDIDVSGDCAVAKLIVHKGRHYFSTDYMLLYRLEEGWRIVAKVFSTTAQADTELRLDE